MGSPPKSPVALMLLMTVLGSTLASTPSSYSLDSAAIREVLTAAMKCQSIRQLHVAVVHKDSDVYSVKLELQSDGQVRDIPDTERKLLYMASVSKGMFGTALVRVEQYLRDTLNNQSFSLFTTPIKQLLRDENFWFLDHIRSDMVTIDDLVSHRTGLARHDAMWYLSTWQSKEDLVKHMSRLEATGEFRNSFIYNNLVWTLADYVVQKLTNRSFVQYMREFLWHPLGMRDTHGSSEMTRQLWDRVDFSHGFRPMGLPLPVSEMERSTGVVEAAGGILGSLSDMMKYMKLHARQNYSAYQEAPGQFKPLNAQAAESGFNLFFNPQLYNDSINPSELEIESYTRGWLRTWYRGQLDYSHGGSLLGIRCELDVFVKQNLAVFNHMTLGPASSSYQAFYAVVINKYLADLLIANQSYVSKDNVCSLFRNAGNSGVARIQRRQLTDDEVDALKGSYGNYGFGKVQMSYNQTSRTMRLAYGIGVLELVPLQLNANQRLPYQFFLNLLEPVEFGELSPILNRTDDAIYVPVINQQSPTSYVTVSRDTDGKLVIESVVLERGMLLRKDLDPNSWTRPRLCNPASVATPLTWISLLLMAAGASSAFRAGL